jgi:hypothetical protein
MLINHCIQYASIHNAPLPADGPGGEQFSNILLFSLLGLTPYYLAWKLGGGLKTAIFFAIFTSVPILTSFWAGHSAFSPRKNEKAKFPGKRIEEYLTFHKEEDREKYYGRNKIPMHTFYEKYFAGEVDVKGDMLDVLEVRHDWASFRFTIGLMVYFITGMMPEVIMHTRSQGMIPLSHLFIFLVLGHADKSERRGTGPWPLRSRR